MCTDCAKDMSLQACFCRDLERSNNSLPHTFSQRFCPHRAWSSTCNNIVNCSLECRYEQLEKLYNISKLTELILSDNPRLVRLPDSLLCHPQLRKLVVSRCSRLKSLQLEIREKIVPSLQKLVIVGEGCPALSKSKKGKKEKKVHGSRGPWRSQSFMEKLRPRSLTPTRSMSS